MFAAWLPNTRWVGRTHHGWSHRCSTCSPSGTEAWLSCQAMRAAWVGRPRPGSCTRARPSGRASAPSHGQQPSGPSSTTDTLAQNLATSIGTGHTLARLGDAVTDLPVSLTAYLRYDVVLGVTRVSCRGSDGLVMAPQSSLGIALPRR